MYLCIYLYCLLSIYLSNTIHIYSGITSGRVLDGELLYTEILEVNLFAFAYRLFHRDFSPIKGAYYLSICLSVCLSIYISIYCFKSLAKYQ